MAGEGEGTEGTESTEGGSTIATKESTDAAGNEQGGAEGGQTKDGQAPEAGGGEKGDQSKEGKEGGSGSEAESGKSIEPIALKLSDETRLADGHAESLIELSTELGLNQEQAEKMLARDEEVVADSIKRIETAYEEQTTQWAEDVKADPEIGGGNFDKTGEFARAAITRFGNADFKAELDRTGLGNHPELVRFCRKVGEAMAAEGSEPVTGGAPKESKPDVKKSIFSKSLEGQPKNS